MPVSQKISVFTTAMRAEFANAYQAIAVPAEYLRYTTVIGSTARIEHYTWMSPTPGLDLYKGHRRYGKIEDTKYSVENKEFDTGFEVLLRDVEDDQTKGYMMAPQQLAQRAKVFPSRWVLKHLANAETALCFDGTAMAADSHTIGTGDNLISYTSTGSSDGLTFNMVALHHGGMLKPLIYQDRKPPVMKTTAGTPQSNEAKIARYFLDMEGAAAYGYWWDLIWVNVTNTPSVADMHNIYAAVSNRFRTFQLPKSLDTEDGEYIHEQAAFSTANLTYVASVGLENLLRQSLNAEQIPQTVVGGQGTGAGTAQTVNTLNLFQGHANYVITNYL